MTVLLAGIDFSSVAIDAALIPLDSADTSVPPVTFRRFELPRFKAGATTSQYRSVERARAIVGSWPGWWWDGTNSGVYGVTSVWVEEPFGHSQNVMRELYGAILASIPPHIAVSTITPSQWRKHHGIGSTKREALDKAWFTARRFDTTEHQADALLLALAGRDLEHQGKAA